MEQAQAAAAAWPVAGDHFWVRTDQVYFGEVKGTTPGGRKYVLEFPTRRVPKIDGARKKVLHVEGHQLVEHPMPNVRWKLVLPDKRKDEERAQLSLVDLDDVPDAGGGWR